MTSLKKKKLLDSYNKLDNAVPEPMILPATFNVPMHVVFPFNCVIPLTFKLDKLV